MISPVTGLPPLPMSFPRMSLAATGETLFGGKKSPQKTRRGCVVSNSRQSHSSGAVHATSPRTRKLTLVRRCASKGGRWLSRFLRAVGEISANSPRFSAPGIQGVYARLRRVRNPWRFFRPISWRQERGARNGELHSGKKRWLERYVGGGHLAENWFFQRPTTKNLGQ